MAPGSRTRRAILAALPVAAGGAAGVWLLRGAPGPALTPVEALAMADSGALLIVDIRRPDEWARTGTASPAEAIDMRREDFVAALGAVRSADIAVALICARGVRSRRLQRRLVAAGMAGIYDIPEGMEGSRAGPGWIARGLPVRFPDGES
jgi:rhodanese-related sulfurtransferase